MSIVAVDFDGTSVQHLYPLVGQEVEGAVEVLRELVAQGHSLILWTMRSGPHLDDAVQWYAERGIPLFGVNRNPTQSSWTDSPKAYAQVYIDDAALGCPLVHDPGADRPRVDWEAVRRLLVEEGLLQ